MVVCKSFRCICQLHFLRDHHHSSSLQVSQIFHSPRVTLEYIRVSHSVIGFWEMLTKQFYQPIFAFFVLFSLGPFSRQAQDCRRVHLLAAASAF